MIKNLKEKEFKRIVIVIFMEPGFVWKAFEMKFCYIEMIANFKEEEDKENF